MASVILNKEEARQGRLPFVCIRCGARASGQQTKRMSWHPPWIFWLLLLGLLPFLIVALVLQKQATLRAPFCAHHQNHWSWRTLTIWLSFAGLVGVGVLLALANAAAPQRGPQQDVLFGLLCFGSIALLAGWVILVLVLSLTSIRPQRITDDELELTGVSPAFVDALTEMDQEDRREYEDFQRWRRSRRAADGDDFEPERPPPPRQRAQPPRLPGTPPDAIEPHDSHD